MWTLHTNLYVNSMKYVSIIISTLYYLLNAKKWINPPTHFFVGRIIGSVSCIAWKLSRQNSYQPDAFFVLSFISSCQPVLAATHALLVTSSPPRVGSQNRSCVLVTWLHFNWSMGSCLLPCQRALTCILSFSFVNRGTRFSCYGRGKVVGRLFWNPGILKCVILFAHLLGT